MISSLRNFHLPLPWCLPIQATMTLLLGYLFFFSLPLPSHYFLLNCYCLCGTRVGSGLPLWLGGDAGAAGDVGSIPGSRRSPGGGNGNPLLYFCLENPMDRGGWWATVHRVAQSQTGLKWLSIHAHVRSVCQLFACLISSLPILQTICQDPSPAELWLAAKMLGYVYNQLHCTPTSLLLILKRAPPTVSPLPKFPCLISSDLTPTQSSGLSSNVPVLGKPSLILLVELCQCQELHLIVLRS